MTDKGGTNDFKCRIGKASLANTKHQFYTAGRGMEPTTFSRDEKTRKTNKSLELVSQYRNEEVGNQLEIDEK